LRAHDGAPGATRETLVEAAVATLREEGFSGASARAIAARARCNQALVFYHFGTVANLLLAALDETSRRRMASYRDTVESASSLVELVAAASTIYREDLDQGHMAVLAEMVAGQSAIPGLGEEIAARIAPWLEFTESTLGTAMASTPFAGLVPTGDVAYAVVALYLGMELLTHIDGDRSRADALFATANRLATLIGPVLGGVAGAAPAAGPHEDGVDS
jgi:AcrR family transcriptional regulator